MAAIAEVPRVSDIITIPPETLLLDENIVKLLTADYTSCIKDKETNEFDDICTLKMLMYKYESSPYDKIFNKLFDLYEYNKLREELNPKCENLDNIVSFRLCQSHGGDLFAHSQWSALQIIKWFDEKNINIIGGLDLNETVLCAFFHDIGKGYDCIFGMYDDKKYDKKGDHVHPEYCGDVILGKIDLQKCDGKGGKINIRNFIEKNFKNHNVNHIALTAYMHWEFGKLNNGPKKDLIFRVFGYLNTFFQTCLKLGIEHSEKLLKLCIAIGCADITASTNKRLMDLESENIKIAKQNYATFNPWEFYEMNKRYGRYRQAVISHYNVALSLNNLNQTSDEAHFELQKD